MMVPSFAPGREIPDTLTGPMAQGLGEYPGYYCYDKDRPSFLPYFLDDITESKCKWNPATVAGNIYHCATGAADCGEPSAAMKDPTVSGPGVAAPGEPANVPRCNSFQNFNPDSGTCEFDFMKPSVLLLGGGAALLAFLLIAQRR